MPTAKKHVTITGCSRGLGRALALGFDHLGWTVSGCARNQQALTQLSIELKQEATLIPCDVSHENEVASFADTIVDGLGAPDLLLNNAAIINDNAPLWEISAKEFSRIIDINIKGVASVIRHFVPPMIKRGTGILVNFSSGWGRSTSPDVAPYCATKYAIEGLSSALAQELPAGLAAAALNPGIIDTDMLRSSFGPSSASYEDPAEWALRAVPYLASLDADCNGRPLTAP